MQKTILAAFLIVIAFTFTGKAENPNSFNYQGRITDPGGNPVPNGNYLVKFIIYDAAVGGTNLWDAGFQNVSIVNGVFSIALGTPPMPALPDGIFEDSTRYLGITVGADPELTPRTRLTSAAYAYSPWKKSASIIEPKDETDLLRIGNGLFHGSGERLAIKWDSPSWIGMSIGSTDPNSIPWYGYVSNDILSCYHYFQGNQKKWLLYNQNVALTVDSLQNVGIGTTSPAAKLDVFTNDLTGIRVRNSLGNLNAIGIYSEMTTFGSHDNHAVQGAAINDTTGDFGIGGYFEGGYMGTYTKGYRYGVYGFGRDAGATPTNTYGVYGIVTGGDGSASVHYGVYGTASGAATNWAGYFSGNVNVTGTLSKGGGSFKIDHPLDPENKYLYHSFVESPDMMNIYNGNITTDRNGFAVVTMPDYFDALNKDFRYQLTVIGEFAQAIIGEKIHGNTFTIRTDKPNIEVSWQVTGVRQDAFANANRIQVEVDKPAEERGLYAHPEAFGRSIEQGIDYKHSPEAEAELRNQEMDR